VKEIRACDQAFLFYFLLFFPQFCGFENLAFHFKILSKKFKFSLKKPKIS
jgi:hypothetical protein